METVKISVVARGGVGKTERGVVCVTRLESGPRRLSLLRVTSRLRDSKVTFPGQRQCVNSSKVTDSKSKVT